MKEFLLVMGDVYVWTFSSQFCTDACITASQQTRKLNAIRPIRTVRPSLVMRPWWKSPVVIWGPKSGTKQSDTWHRRNWGCLPYIPMLNVSVWLVGTGLRRSCLYATHQNRSFLHYTTYSQTYSGVFTLRSVIATHRPFSKRSTVQNSTLPPNTQ
jgi:hypothetical protein